MMSESTTAVSNGSQPIEILREHPTNPHLLRGFGPLVVGIVLLLLMTLMAPTVAPEERLTRPVETTRAAPAGTTGAAAR
jgi:hypothetical protein